MFWRLESNQRRNAYETFLRTVSHQDIQDTKDLSFQIDSLVINLLYVSFYSKNLSM